MLTYYCRIVRLQLAADVDLGPFNLDDELAVNILATMRLFFRVLLVVR
jgi:hypothetical protein